MKLTTRLLLLALLICLGFSVALSSLLQIRAFRADLDRETRRGLQGKELFAASMQASVQAFDGGRDTENLQRALRITVQYMRQAGLMSAVPFSLGAVAGVEVFVFDFLSVFAEYDIAWANWDHRGAFGIVDHAGNPTAIAPVLFPSAD